jgi:hypothetical protein
MNDTSCNGARALPVQIRETEGAAGLSNHVHKPTDDDWLVRRGHLPEHEIVTCSGGPR